MRLALGLEYCGSGYLGWQSQPGGRTVQDHLEAALSRFADSPIQTVCAGRTDSGVHAINQVVHFDTLAERAAFSWVRGPNTFLPPDISVQWCATVPDDFHARNHARGRRYAYVLRESAARPAVEAGRVGWVFRPLDAQAMREAAAVLVGTHDFSAFRSSECQAASPVKELRRIDITRHGAYWRFDFEANAFLHHMIRNLMGCLIAVGQGTKPVTWMNEVLASRRREQAAPTFMPDGLYFLGPYYDRALGLPDRSSASDWLP
ncbi:MAG TPA: tRNA pseudouridine(38-40) synthase TruA [Burkholderiaceae bacterium]|jgi:tRNA pseudouridine38-40 synthase|nr:tRNA pseudouridine(38-40) synthase TruA [Burkholderiaceae bacterium]